jgi:RIO-like serine/threonine protein kinase
MILPSGESVFCHAMEFVPGAFTRDELQREALKLDEKRQWAIVKSVRILRVLSLKVSQADSVMGRIYEIWMHGVMHRDLDFRNIVMSLPRLSFVLVDFTHSRPYSQDAAYLDAEPCVV